MHTVSVQQHFKVSIIIISCINKYKNTSSFVWFFALIFNLQLQLRFIALYCNEYIIKWSDFVCEFVTHIKNQRKCIQYKNSMGNDWNEFKMKTTATIRKKTVHRIVFSSSSPSSICNSIHFNKTIHCEYHNRPIYLYTDQLDRKNKKKKLWELKEEKKKNNNENKSRTKMFYKKIHVLN